MYISHIHVSAGRGTHQDFILSLFLRLFHIIKIISYQEMIPQKHIHVSSTIDKDKTIL